MQQQALADHLKRQGRAMILEAQAVNRNILKIHILPHMISDAEWTESICQLCEWQKTSMWVMTNKSVYRTVYQ